MSAALLESFEQDMAPMTASADQLGSVLTSNADADALARATATLDQLEASQRQMERDWRERIMSMRGSVQPGDDARLDALIDRFRAGEQSAAKRLQDFRDKFERSQVMPLAQLQAERLEECLVRWCEQYRDVRWDLMALQSEKRDRSKDRPFTGVSDLRRQVLAAR